ncbi:MAG: iron-siderophore ABC transporter substrate-binding protein [Devosia sp.]
MFRRFVALLILAFSPLPAVAQDAFPVTVKHIYGETVIPAQPKRIVVWGTNSQDAVLQLGVVPVGIPFFSYGGGDDGILPWDDEAIKALGGPAPEILPNGGEIPLEKIAALKPDLILAHFSGITKEEYDTLSQIAPVVAYPKEAWGTSWQDVILIAGQAMGKSAEAKTLVDEAQQAIVDGAAKYPQLKGKTFAGVSDYNGEVAIYAALDARMKYVEDMGLVLAPGVNEQDPAKGQGFYYGLSYENFDKLNPDILITYFENDQQNADFLSKPGVAGSPVVTKGAIAAIIGQEFVYSVSPPTGLSLKWGLDKYLALLAAAADKSGR